jgi:hypothetical protein
MESVQSDSLKVSQPRRTYRMLISPAFILDAAKLSYLLRPRAKDDMSKFLAQAGFSINQPAALADAIRSVAGTADVVSD